MKLFYMITAVIVAITDIVLTVIWLIKFPRKIKALSGNGSDTDENFEINRSKMYFKEIEKLFYFNFPAFLISLTVFILRIVTCDGVQFYATPLLIAICGIVCIFIPLNIFIYTVGKKNGIKVLFKLDNKLYPVGTVSNLITAFSVFIGLLISSITACAVYLIMLI